MRVISGTAKGTKLYSLEGNNTRPTLDRVKESLFNVIHNKVQNSLFLDLFSGSGAIGIEAASRGAQKIILCDKSKEAINIVNKNVEKTHLREKIEVINMDYEIVLNTRILEKQDIIYIDPPYKTDFAYKAVKIILDKDLISNDSIIIIETDNEEEILNKVSNLNLEVKDNRKYGRAHLIFLKKV